MLQIRWWFALWLYKKDVGIYWFDVGPTIKHTVGADVLPTNAQWSFPEIVYHTCTNKKSFNPVRKVTLVQRRLTVVSDVGLTSNAVVILFNGSTLARLIGSTLARRCNVLFPMVSRPISNVQILCIGRQHVCPDEQAKYYTNQKGIQD
jgi:hypothetical protein